MSRLLDEYESRRAAYSREFTCKVTGLALRMEKPRFRNRRAAEAMARTLWREQSGEDLIMHEYVDLARACMIGQCLYEQGSDEPVGADILELDEDLLGHYDAILTAIENPPIEELPAELLDEMVEDLRGKSKRVVQHLNVIEGSMLDHLLRYMASRLSESATTTCSSSSSSTTS